MATGSPPGQLVSSDVWVAVKSALWTLFALVMGAALTALADGLITTVLPQLKDQGVIDVVLFGLLTTLVDAFRKAIQLWLKDTRPFVVLLVLGLFLAPSEAFAEDVTIKLSGITRGQSYELTYNADGTLLVRPIVVVVVGGGPGPAPVPTPNPTLGGQVAALTASTLAEGGSHSAAANLAAVYSVVASQLEAGNLTLAQVAPALKSLTDSMLAGPGEAAKWTKWRTGIGDLLANRMGDKATAVASLRSVESGIKSAVDASSAITGGKAIDWAKLIETLMPLILKLLELFLNK